MPKHIRTAKSLVARDPALKPFRSSLIGIRISDFRFHLHVWPAAQSGPASLAWAAGARAIRCVLGIAADAAGVCWRGGNGLVPQLQSFSGACHDGFADVRTLADRRVSKTGTALARGAGLGAVAGARQFRPQSLPLLVEPRVGESFLLADGFRA